MCAIVCFIAQAEFEIGDGKKRKTTLKRTGNNLVFKEDEASHGEFGKAKHLWKTIWAFWRTACMLQLVFNFSFEKQFASGLTIQVGKPTPWFNLRAFYSFKSWMERVAARLNFEEDTGTVLVFHRAMCKRFAELISDRHGTGCEYPQCCIAQLDTGPPHLHKCCC